MSKLWYLCEALSWRDPSVYTISDGEYLTLSTLYCTDHRLESIPSDSISGVVTFEYVIVLSDAHKPGWYSAAAFLIPEYTSEVCSVRVYPLLGRWWLRSDVCVEPKSADSSTRLTPDSQLWENFVHSSLVLYPRHHPCTNRPNPKVQEFFHHLEQFRLLLWQ